VGPESEHADPWEELRRYTAARIGVGRSGGSLPTRELLRFELDHARAVDAVFAELDPAALAREVSGLGLETLCVRSRAGDRSTFLRRPDLGRRLDEAAAQMLSTAAMTQGGADVLFLLTDGLSALAVHRHTPPLLGALLPKLGEAGLTVGPLILVEQGRVAIQDEIGTRLNARVAVSLIGERPGLAAPDSLGAYLVHGPRLGNTDAERNCVSNIRPEGLPYPAAAETLRFLILGALRLGLSGVGLKDTRDLVSAEPSLLPDR